VLKRDSPISVVTSGPAELTEPGTEARMSSNPWRAPKKH
jgi:hypothetical protein